MDSTEFNYTYPEVSTHLLDTETSAVLESLDNDEKIVQTARQRRVSGAVISPSVYIATSKRLIIVNRIVEGVKSDIAFIPYRKMSSARVSHGVFFSSLHIAFNDGELGMVLRGVKNGEIRINGLDKDTADQLFLKIYKLIPQEGAKTINIYGNVINNIYVGTNMMQKERAHDEDGRVPSYTMPTFVDTEFEGSNELGDYSNTLGLPKIEPIKSSNDLLIFKMRNQRAKAESENTDGL